jgi:serine/threonine-protein phosphatase 2A regulatory subunit B''
LVAFENLLNAFAVPHPSSGELIISYSDFKRIHSRIQDRPSLNRFLTPVIFLKLSSGHSGSVRLSVVMQFINSKIQKERMHIQLQYYDMIGHGYLRESDLENFIFELISSLTGLASLEPDFVQFYVYTAVRKFMFCLDPRRLGRVSISDLLTAPALEELLALRSAQVSPNNWFSVSCSVGVYMRYLEMDLDGNGMLAPGELKKCPGAALSDFTVERIFQEYMTYERELDYKGYLDMVLAMENKDEAVSRKYWWRLIDVERRGTVGRREIDACFRSILLSLNQDAAQMYKLADLFNEVMDMIGLSNQTEMKLEDVLKHPQGGLVLRMLTDAHAFYLYENREHVVQQS